MKGNARYIPPESKNWQGRNDIPPASCFFQIIRMLDLRNPISATLPAIGLIGFCCDEGIRRNLGRIGATDGPKAIRETLAKLPFPRQDMVCYDAGDITCTDGNLESAQAALADAIALLLQHHITPIILGGGHELAWGSYQGIAKQFVHENLGIVNFDAHFDMRPLLAENQGSSGTPFLQIAEAHQSQQRKLDYNCIGIQPAGNIQLLFDTAKKYAANILFAEDLQQNSAKKSFDFIQRVIDQNQILYLSLCLDVFAAPYAPGVSAIQSLGVTPWQIIPLVRQLASSGKVVTYDIAELSPKFDIDARTAKLAANFIYEIILHHEPYKG